ncbi:MAG TPA: YciI-like protein [Actinomycetales bacterium]|nr:YciI-like protein [Actinomycetales bacterium]
MAYALLEYQLVSDYLDRRGELREEHLGLAQAAAERGDIALAGALADPADRAVFVFTGSDADAARTAAEQFAASDPYVAGGLVTSWAVRPWNVVVGG